MIIGFKDRATEDLYNGVRSKHSAQIATDIQSVARRKLDMLNAAHRLEYLKVPPGNRLESLKGKYSGHMSIRVNDQYGIVFKWEHGSASDVRIEDYH